ncbi:TetR/AcrR family transcriptional regulator [uncultured Robinsoniella sp.]|uniref:TetR/AcrR family transcriptional regulator n=1 Tax=uncultured Robinsoniella sp. TaxID=904190 RepID=UPI00374F804B
MRISKEPEVRKQEIIDVAMKVFAEKGYEAATMKDIAKEADVVAGLCYHYFQNKQELYNIAVTQYAKECSRAFISIFQQTELTLDECLDAMERISISQEHGYGYKYKEFFNKEGNELFHKQLELYMSKEIFPYMQKYVACLAERNEIHTEDSGLLAHFLWSGQSSVMNEESVPVEKRVAFIRDIFKKILG